MDWIYLSPHLDDVVFSCGGLIWEQVNTGEAVQIWTICAGDPPTGELSSLAKMLHKRWNTDQDAVRVRRLEDQIACSRLGAMFCHFNIPDCIYRTDGKEFLYNTETSLNLNLQSEDMPLVQRICSEIKAQLPMNAQVVSPLALGNHVDHQLVRLASDFLQVELGDRLLYYADYPYASQDSKGMEAIQAKWEKVPVDQVSPQGLTAWQESMAAYGSQVSTFWQDVEQMQTKVGEYFKKMGGTSLWRNKR